MKVKEWLKWSAGKGPEKGSQGLRPFAFVFSFLGTKKRSLSVFLLSFTFFHSYLSKDAVDVSRELHTVFESLFQIIKRTVATVEDVADGITQGNVLFFFFFFPQQDQERKKRKKKKGEERRGTNVLLSVMDLLRGWERGWSHGFVCTGLRLHPLNERTVSACRQGGRILTE